ncbi:MAG TPA: glycosyltransferase [Candidatus Acidoferrales bacterium]|nr:glycosyltransferase [Candidatus Acidoferrales bacterium]
MSSGNISRGSISRLNTGADARSAAVSDSWASAAQKAARYRDQRISYWNSYSRRSSSNYYHGRLNQIYQFVIPPGQRVLELGCGEGDLLAALKPSSGVGVDFSPEMITRARQKYPELDFLLKDVHDLSLSGKFDYIILSDLVNDLWDVEQVFERIAPLCGPQTRIVINSYSRLWEAPLAVVRRLKLANPSTPQNWLTPEDLENMFYLNGFETVRRWQEILFPLQVPALSSLCNRFLAKFAPFRIADLTNFLIVRPAWQSKPALERQALVSVVVPTRNEAGNIESIFRRVPEMGAGTELVFVEGHSTDDTYAEIERVAKKFPNRRVKILRQSGRGKGDAVRTGFAAADGDVLMILDADLTVPPEDLTHFYDVLRSGKGEFVNGVRLVYPMEGRAMRFFNLVGNKFFAMAFSWLLGQKIKDTLCGTKVLSRQNYDLIARNRDYFGDFDPFGDFDLIFGAAKLNLKIVDVPVRYAERTYGETNIARWRHGWLLLRMVMFASSRIKFV